MLLGEGHTPGNCGAVDRELVVLRSVRRASADRLCAGNFGFRHLRLHRCCVRARVSPRAAYREVADEMCHAASIPSKSPPLELVDAACSWAVCSVRIYSAAITRETYATA